MTAQTIDGSRTALFDFQPGLKVGWNRVAAGNPTDRTPEVNAGITAFFRYDVMFDVQNGGGGFEPVGD